MKKVSMVYVAMKIKNLHSSRGFGDMLTKIWFLNCSVRYSTYTSFAKYKHQPYLKTNFITFPHKIQIVLLYSSKHNRIHTILVVYSIGKQ